MENNSEQLDRIEGLVESLAIATAKGFEGVNERFGEIDKRFDEVDKRFEKVESRLDGLQRAVDAGFERTGLLEARISKVEQTARF